MNVNDFLTLIAKYSLDGICQSAVLECANNKVNVTTKSASGNLVVDVSWNSLKIDDGKYGIFDTSKLALMLKVMTTETIDITIETTSDGSPMALHMSDGIATASYALAHTSLFKKITPNNSTIVYTDSIELSDQFCSSFLSYKSAMKKSEYFTLASNGKSDITCTIGDSTSNSNKIKVKLPHASTEVFNMKLDINNFSSVLKYNVGGKKTLNIVPNKAIRLDCEYDDHKSMYYLFMEK